MLSHWGELWPVVGENMELRVGNIQIAGVGGRGNAAFLKIKPHSARLSEQKTLKWVGAGYSLQFHLHRLVSDPRPEEYRLLAVAGFKVQDFVNFVGKFG